MPDQENNTAQQSVRMVKTILRGTGVVFLVLGICVFFDAGSLVSGYFGTAPYLGDDIMFHHVIGAILFIFGLFDIFVVPEILFRKNEDKVQ